MYPERTAYFRNCERHQLSITSAFDMPLATLPAVSTTFRSLCLSRTGVCQSLYGTEYVLSEMMQYLVRVSSRHRLQFVTACDYHTYMHRRKALPPLFGAIAVDEAEVVRWVHVLGQARATTTFVLEHDATDGSLAHLRYSRSLDVRVLIYVLPRPISTYNITKRGRVWQAASSGCGRRHLAGVVQCMCQV